MAMNKVYTRINWEDYPSENTDIDEINLNKMDSAIDALDNRIILQDALKVDKSSINGNIADWTMDETTGVITITKYNGEKIIFDLNIEKIDDSIPQISDAEQKSDNKKIVSVCFEQLDDLMKSTDIKEDELRQVVWERGYYPLDTPINKYDPEFVAGVLVAAWDQVCAMILNNRENIPF